MPKQTRTELPVGAVIDLARMSHSRLQKRIEPPVVFAKQSCERTSLSLFSSTHRRLQLCPTSVPCHHDKDHVHVPPADLCVLLSIWFVWLVWFVSFGSLIRFISYVWSIWFILLITRAWF
jgi:hypothetical protein